MNQLQIDYVAWGDGDWYALYIDGKLVRDGHSISGRDMLDALGIYYHRWDIPCSEDSGEDPAEFCRIAELSTLTRMLTEGY